ncbi:MAG: hypothetical protein JWP32_2898 [Schumannella sp.]|nr:hypothetical protein [Schumannella sp.]
MYDIPVGWATLIAATITSIGGVVAFILSVRSRGDVKQIRADVTQTKTDAREVKEQVKNSHTTNMREEGDDRHQAVMRELGTIKNTQATHGRQIGDLQRTQRGMQKDIGRLADADQEQIRSDHRLGDRITDLEKTGEHPARRRNGES